MQPSFGPAKNYQVLMQELGAGTVLAAMCCVLVLTLSEVAFGAVEIHYATKYQAHNVMCSETWGNLRLWIKAAGILNVIAGSVSTIAVCQQLQANGGENPCMRVSNTIQTGQLIISIWAMAAFYQLQPASTCGQVWALTPELLSLVKTHVVLFYITLGCVAVGCCVGCGMAICGLTSNATERDVERGFAHNQQR